MAVIAIVVNASLKLPFAINTTLFTSEQNVIPFKPILTSVAPTAAVTGQSISIVPVDIVIENILFAMLITERDFSTLACFSCSFF